MRTVTGVFLQILRGDTYNYVFVDESCFVRPSAFGEVVPMLLTDNGHMVLTSSHKSGQDSRTFVDMKSLRRTQILINNVVHVCPNHIVSMLNNDVTAMCCPCYLFHQPHHITADADYRRILNAFSQRSGPRVDDDETGDAKTVMLSEVGILPPGLSLQDVNDSTKRQLASVRGSEKFCSKLVDVRDYVILGRKRHLVFSRDIVVYIDPAPTNVGRSYHAMCFVTRAEELNPQPGETRYRYVILAVEEFQTDDVDSQTRDGLLALATVFTTTCSVLTRLYEGYFTTFIVAPEANSIHVDPFWSRCGVLYAKDPTLIRSQVTILGTTIQTPSVKARMTDCEKEIRKRYKPYLKKKEITSAKAYEFQYLFDKCDYEPKNAQSYRIGYALGGNKVSKIYNFFSSFYNPTSGNVCDVSCATTIWSWWIGQYNRSIPVYVAKKLELLEIRPTISQTTGKTVYKIGGKKKEKDGSFVQDDLPIAVVMSVCLCADICGGCYRGDLVRLETRQTYQQENENEVRFDVELGDEN